MAAVLQKQVQDAIDRQVDSGVERGVQVAVYRRGEQVVRTFGTGVMGRSAVPGARR